MELFTLFGIAFLGAIIGSVPVAPTAVVYGSQLQWSPWAVGLVCMVGQTLGFSVLLFGGRHLLARWKKLAQQVEHTRQLHMARLERGFLPISAVSAVTGLPPLVALSILAPAFQVQPVPFLGIAAVGRFIRYALLAGAGLTFSAWFSR